MKPKQIVVKGTYLFFISLIIFGTILLTVYLSGLSYERSFVDNFYLSLGIIAGALFLFLSGGLYWGIAIQEDYSKIKLSKRITAKWFTDIPPYDIAIGFGDLEGILFGILLWLFIGLGLIVYMWLLQMVGWLSTTGFLAMLYGVFLGGVQQVFRYSPFTQGRLGFSLLYALTFTIAYTGWMFAVLFIGQSFS